MNAEAPSPAPDRHDLAWRRLHTLGLEGEPLGSPEDVVRWLGAVQSQDFAPAKWSVAQRTAGVTEAGMGRAFDSGAILRTHVLRPTWHFVLPEDIRWLLAATAPRVHASNAFMYRRLDLDPSTRARIHGILVRALEHQHHLTRAEVQATLAGAGVTASGQRLGYILMSAELDALICSGPLKGKQHTYALLDERAPSATRLSRDEALAELTRRYFTSHGPASARDLKAWASLTLADVRHGLAMARATGALEQATFAGIPCWFAPPAGSRIPPSPAPPLSPRVHLLQPYDEYVMGYSETRAVLDTADVAPSLTRDRAAFNGVIVLDTQVAGCWKRTLRKGAVQVEARLYRPFGPVQRQALQAAADRFAAFLDLPIAVVQISA